MDCTTGGDMKGLKITETGTQNMHMSSEIKGCSSTWGQFINLDLSAAQAPPTHENSMYGIIFFNSNVLIKAEI